MKKGKKGCKAGRPPGGGAGRKADTVYFSPQEKAVINAARGAIGFSNYVRVATLMIAGKGGQNAVNGK
jgi:hypothetical protein